MKNYYKTALTITFEHAFKEFQLYNQARGLSEKSIIYYDSCYKYFTEFFPEKQPCRKINLTTYRDYCLYLQEHKKSMKLLCRLMSADFVPFFTFVWKETTWNRLKSICPVQ